MAETVIAVIPLPMDMDMVAKVLTALSARFPGASVRDGEHSGTYLPRTAPGLPVRTMEVFVEDGRT